MAITLLDNQSAKSTGTGSTITVTLNDLTGNDVAIVAAVTARTVNLSFSITGVTWDGGSMGAAVVSETANLNGFPAGYAQIYVLPIGNPSALTANCVVTINTSAAARGLTVFAVQGIDQASPTVNTAQGSVISAATSTSRNVATGSGESMAIDVVTCAAGLTGTEGGPQTKVANEIIRFPQDATHLVSYVHPAADPQTMSWTWGNSSYNHACVSLRDSGFTPSAIAKLDDNTVIGAGTNGDPVTIPLGPLTGNDVAIILCASASKETSKLTPTSATWNGTGMTPEALAAGNPNFGSGHQLAEIYVLPIGDVTSLSANVVYTLGGTPSGAGRICYAAAYSGVSQTNPVFNTATFGDGSLGTGTSRTDTVNAPDDSLVIDCMSISEASAMTFTQGPGETIEAELNNGAGAGEHMRLGVASFNPGSTPTQSMGWSFANSVRAHAVASFNVVAPVVITDTVSQKGTNAIIDVRETGITVNGTGMLGTGDTVVVYASSSDYATAILVPQSTSNVTDTSVTWDFPSLGVIGRGMKFIFVVKNFGLGSASISDAFAVQVEAFVSSGVEPITRIIHVTDGNTGNQTIVSGLSYTPKAAIITATANTSLDTTQPDSPATICLVAENGTAGDAVGGKTAGGTVFKRKQNFGTSSLRILNSSSSGAADLVTGTPVLTSDGLDINFTANTAGLRLWIYLMGGDDVSSEVVEVQISDGSYSGLPFTPELLFGSSICLTQGTAGDQSFSIRAVGWANATDQAMMAWRNNTTRNCMAKTGSFLAQVGGTGYDWEMSLTGLTVSGFTWTGSNADSAYVLCLNLNGRQTFVGQYTTSASGADGMSETLPDLGFVPEVIAFATASRTNETISSTLGGRYSFGSVTAALDNRCTATWWLPDTGTGVAEQYMSDTLCIAGSSVSGSPTFTGKITVFGQVSTIQYPIKPAAGLLVNLLAIEAGSSSEIAEDGDGAMVPTLYSGEDIVP